MCNVMETDIDGTPLYCNDLPLIGLLTQLHAALMSSESVHLSQPKGTTINDLGGGAGGNREKKISHGPSPGKNYFS